MKNEPHAALFVCQFFNATHVYLLVYVRGQKQKTPYGWLPEGFYSSTVMMFIISQIITYYFIGQNKYKIETKNTNYTNVNRCTGI